MKLFPHKKIVLFIYEKIKFNASVFYTKLYTNDHRARILG